MRVSRDLAHRQRDCFHTSGLRQNEAVALMKRNSPAQVGQREGALAIAAIGRPDQVEQRLVFADRQQLTFAKHPSGWSKISREHADLTDIGLCHYFVLRSATGRCPAGRYRTTAS